MIRRRARCGQLFRYARSMLKELKLATASLHARAEAAMPTLEELTRIECYARCLADLHGFYAAWEPAIWQTSGVSDVVCDGDARRKLPLLERDLRALAHPVIDDRPLLHRESSMPTCAEALGALYVFEGAT